MANIIDYDNSESYSGMGVPIYSKKEMTNNITTRFFRHGYLDVYNGLDSTKEYIFITKPDLHLLDGGKLNPELANYPIFSDYFKSYPNIFYELQSSCGINQTSPFITICTNTVRSTMDLPSIDGTDTETAATSYGESITYRSTSIQSDSKHEFTLEFDDEKYTPVYKMFKIWDEYIRLKDKGLITPPSKDYTTLRRLHDQVSAYKVIVDNEGENILFFAKGWGVYPKRIPRDTFSSMPVDGKLGISIPFHCEWIEDFDPMILMDFKTIVAEFVKGKEAIDIFDTENWVVNMETAVCPDIEFDHDEGHHGMWQLIWYK